MRITISGAQSTGKTTIINKLKTIDEFSAFRFNDENMRNLKSKGVKINLEADDESAYIIAESNFSLALEDNYISDRYVLDGLVYAKYHNIKGNISDEVMKYYETRYQDIIKASDLVFYIKPEFDIKDDGFRNIDASFQKEIASIFDYYLNKLNISYTILSGSTEDRIKTFIGTYKKFKGDL